VFASRIVTVTFLLTAFAAVLYTGFGNFVTVDLRISEDMHKLLNLSSEKYHPEAGRFSPF